MEKRKFGNTDIEVTPVGLGTWAIGGWMWGGTDEAQSIDTIHRAVDKGIGLVDTAPVYGFGRSEEVVGKALANGRRDQVALATKAAITCSSGELSRISCRIVGKTALPPLPTVGCVAGC